MIHLPPLIGHRGAAGSAPENTLASFRRAATLGLRMVEFDVRLSGDGWPVVFHDDRLERTTNGFGPVRCHTLASLKTLDAGGWFSPDFSGETIPTLDEVLTLCLELGLAVNMEVKPDRGWEAPTARTALAGALARWPMALAPPLISSFSPLCLEIARDQAPHWPRGLLVDRLPADWRARAARVDSCAIHCDQRRLSQRQVTAMHREGLAVLAYTANDEARARLLWGWGVEAVFSDFCVPSAKNL